MAILTNGRTLRLGLSALVVGASMFALSASAQSRRYGSGITVYTNPNFSGDSVSFRDDTPDLRSYSLNDKISSVDIANGETWEVCQDINYGNRCQVFSGSVSNLRSMGWNDRISSLRRVATGFNGRRTGGVVGPAASIRSQGLVLYERPNFRGASTTVTNDANVGLGRALGSVQVRGGAWQLCDRGGRCATVTRDVPDVSRLGLNGRITSARLLDGAQSYGVYDRAPRSGRWGR